MCIRVYEDNAGFAGSRMKATAIAVLHIFLPMWIVVILRSTWMSFLGLLLISVCLGPVLYGIRLLLSMSVDGIQVPFMESCGIMVWPHCILLLVGVSTRMLSLLLVYDTYK